MKLYGRAKLGKILFGFKPFISKFIFTAFAIFLNSADLRAESPPTVKARISKSNLVSLSIRTALPPRSGSSRLEISRAFNGSKKFENIARVQVRGRTTTKISDQISSRFQLVTYRSRLAGKVRTRWSKKVTIVLSSLSNSGIVPESVNPDVNLNPVLVIVSPDNSVSSPSSGSTNPVLQMPSGFSVCPRTVIVDVFSRVNEARVVEGKAQISEQRQLAFSSLKFSLKMAINSNLSHEGWFENILSSGFHGHSFGQNIGLMNVLSAATVMTGWLNTPGHRSNILSSSFSSMGVGCVIDRKGYVWWTQDFGG